MPTTGKEQKVESGSDESKKRTASPDDTGNNSDASEGASGRRSRRKKAKVRRIISVFRSLIILLSKVGVNFDV